MDSMYEILMNLPLFKGVSYNKISEIVGTVKFHFLKYAPGETVVRCGEPCDHVKFIIKGKLKMSIESRDMRLKVSHTLAAPDVISPDFLFGRNTVYPATGVAITDETASSCGIVQITKTDYMSLLHNDQVFMFNFLNMLSVNAQQSVDGVLALTAGSLEQRIAFWMVSLSQNGATDIELEANHRDLYQMFGVTRGVFFQSLESMRERGFIDYSPNRIFAASRRKLKSLLIPEN